MGDGVLVASILNPSTLLAFFKGACGLGIVIFVHELGHFLVAKACGVKCEKFYVGFDPPLKLMGFSLPRTLFKKKWGETEYGIGIIPLGGYVKMLGQDDNPANAAVEAERAKLAGEELDPRSYPAKSVPQRMAIISAGVIFNLIFGVLFAATAYKLGVKYTPTVIGGTSVGDPAWLAGVQPGDRIVSLEPDGEIDRQLRFLNDLKLRMHALGKREDIQMRLEGLDGEIREVTLEPNSGYEKQVGHPTIGVVMASAPIVGGVAEDSVANKAGLLPADRITAITVDGLRTPIDPNGVGIDLQRILTRSQLKPITLSVERTDEESKQVTTHDVELGIDYRKRLGIELTIGPIQCIQQGSVAERAGLLEGDVMTEINGEPIGDPLTLPVRILDHVGKTTNLTVRRRDETLQIELIPKEPLMMSEVRRRNGPIGLDALGVGYSMNDQVSRVIPGSPAERAGIRAGYTLVKGRVVILGAIPESERWPLLPIIQDSFHEDGIKHRHLRRFLEAHELDKDLSIMDGDNNNWPYLVNFIGQDDETFALDLTFSASGSEETVRLAAEKSDTWVDDSRGFFLSSFEETRVASNWSEAVSLGTREVVEGMQQVVLLLRKLTTHYENLGGPITIARVATHEASQGLPRLLVFLTVLSANLAVLNFLPIPVLDGGHMLFLAYEGVVGKPVDERIQMSLTLVGFSLLMGLMVFVFGLDISRLLG